MYQKYCFSNPIFMFSLLYCSIIYRNLKNRNFQSHNCVLPVLTPPKNQLIFIFSPKFLGKKLCHINQSFNHCPRKISFQSFPDHPPPLLQHYYRKHRCVFLSTPLNSLFITQVVKLFCHSCHFEFSIHVYNSPSGLFPSPLIFVKSECSCSS